MARDGRLADAGAGPGEWDDARLVAATARRDAAAFRVLVQRHAPVLHRLAYRMLGDASAAEDVVQDSLIRLWDNAARFRPSGGGVPAWLRRIATNLCLDRLRVRGRWSDEDAPDVPDPAPAADAAIDADRLGAATQAALAALPDRQRAAVVLTYYAEESNAAAAALLEMKLKAFESLLFRARAALKARLEAAGVTAVDGGPA